MERLLFATFMAPNTTPVYANVVAAVGAALRRPAELVDGAALAELCDGPVDGAFLCGLPYVRLQAERPGALTVLAAPILSEPRYEGRPVYFSDVIVRRDRPFRSFGDLRGASWAHNCADSFSGCLITRYHLQGMGESEAFFGRVSYSGGHLVSIQQVLGGEVDASAIDSHVLGIERRRDPRIDRELRVVASFGPSPYPPIVACSRLSVDIAQAIRDVICALADDPMQRANLAAGMIDRYLPVTDADYDAIRRQLAAVEGSIAKSTAAPTTVVL
jgi:ABC-type phosphate/phosphonate transport system substrate-binding protein